MSKRITLITAAVVIGTSWVLLQAQPNTPSQSDSKGVALFADHCSSCHGANLEGKGHAPPLSGKHFCEGWSSKSTRALYSRIISTMPQDDPGSLAPETVLQIVEFIGSRNGVQWQKRPRKPDDLNKLPFTCNPSASN